MSSAQGTKDQQLEVFYSKLAEVAQAGDKLGYTALFSPNAAMFLPNRPPLQGREQIGDWFEKFLDRVDLVLEIYEQEQIEIVGDIAIVRSRGIGHYRIKSTGEEMPLKQKYLDILRYDSGKWSMTYHVGSSSTLETGLWNLDWEK